MAEQTSILADAEDIIRGWGYSDITLPTLFKQSSSKSANIQLDWTSCVDTQKNNLRETERATTDLNIRMKSSRRGASNGAG